MAIINLYPVGWTTSFGSCTPQGDATEEACVDDPAGAPDDDATRVYFTRGGGLDTTAIVDLQALGQDVLQINSVTVYARIKGETSDRWSAYFRGLDSDSFDQWKTAATPTASWVSHENVYTDNPADSDTFQKADLASPQLQFTAWDNGGATSNWYITQCYVAVDCVLAPTQLEPARDRATRELWYRRQPPDLYTATVPIAFALNNDLNTLVTVNDISLPHETDDGTGVKVWQRRPMLYIGARHDPMRMVSVLSLRDERQYLALFRDTAWATKDAAVTADGIARFDNGNTRSFTRASRAWIPAPADQRVSRIEIDVEAHAYDGDLHEQESENLQKYSSFLDGTGTTFTGWTASGDGTVTEETSILLFDETEVDRCPRMTADSSISTDFQLAGTATASIDADTVCCVSIDHYDVTDHEPFYAIQRGIDSNWWRDSDQTWQASKTWNEMATHTVGDWDREATKPLDVGGGNTTLQVFVGAPASGGTGDQAFILGHVQIEALPYPTSRILTQSSTVTRNAGQLLISNDSGARAINAAQGAFACEVLTEWNAAEVDVASTYKTVFYCEHDADNYLWLYYDGDAQEWNFTFQAGGSTYEATASHAPVRGTAYKLVARWTGVNAEHDLDAYTVSVFVDGVKGTDDVAEALSEAATSDIEIGSHGGAGTDQFDGQIRLIHSLQWCPGDAWIARGIY